MNRPFNQKRSASFRRKSVGELTRIVESGSLSAAAAKYELDRRDRAGQKDLDAEDDDEV